MKGFLSKASLKICCLMLLVPAFPTLKGQSRTGLQAEKISLARASRLVDALPEADPWLRMPDASTLAWSESYIMNALMDLYDATGDTWYLREVASRGTRLLEHRDDRRGVADGSGHIRPAWSMASKYVVAEGALKDEEGNIVVGIRSTPSAYNNFTTVEVIPQSDGRFTLKVRNEHFKRSETYENLSLSDTGERFVKRVVDDPMAPYSTRPGDYHDKKSNLVRIEFIKPGYQGPLPPQQVALSPVPLAFTGYLGVIYHPMLRFSEVVRSHPRLKKLLPYAESFIKAAEESYEDASRRLWREGPLSGEGYYLMCEKGESLPADNVGQPFNYLAKHVCAQLALYRLTGRPEYLERSEKMVNLFKNRLIYDSDKDLYTWNYWYEPMTTTGWKPEDNISHNVKVYEGKARVEDISHGGHDIHMVMAAYKMGIGFDPADIMRFANTFLKNVVTPDRKKITRLVDGSGDYPAYFNSLHQWLVLSEVEPEVARAGEYIYNHRQEETLPFTAKLLAIRR
ncbi:MAG: hypothetical protein ABS46_20735 [Cytophagaceae bacterium SCN 52-12]|nr:MAG: hypothetical protein ABS46_20735 [Cytophagaceae bacterium SCN 52-12]